MEITDVYVTTLTAELDRTHKTSKASFDARSCAIITVETESGITGIGEGLGPEPHLIESVVETELRPSLLGADPVDRERLWREMVHGDIYWDQKGLRVAAASGVDVALWDILGKHYGAPVYELLGGRVTETGAVRAYASDLFWDAPGLMAEAAAEYVGQGFQAVKTHLGRGSLDDDRVRVETISEAIGDAVLMVDTNCGLDRNRAFRTGRMLEEYDVYWFEEPVSPYDIDGYRALRNRLDVPIAGGENEFTKWGFTELFQSSAVDFAMPDILRCGGLTETRKICAVAESFDITVTPHNFSTGVGLAATLHLMASTPGCDWLEFDVTGYPLYEDFLDSPLEISSKGEVSAPTEPGLGVTLSPKLVDQYGDSEGRHQ